MPLLHAFLLWLHLLAAAFWVGGMAVMHFAVRPAAVQALEAPARLQFMAAALARFFAGVTVAIVVLLASGAALIAMAGGFGGVHWGVHLMLAVGLLMVAVFGHIRFGLHRRLQAALAVRDAPAAAASLNAIRRWVGFNLMLGSLVFALGFVPQAL